MTGPNRAVPAGPKNPGGGRAIAWETFAANGESLTIGTALGLASGPSPMPLPTTRFAAKAVIGVSMPVLAVWTLIGVSVGQRVAIAHRD